MGQLKVIKPGFYTTIQDGGRFGYKKFGVPVSGAMDSRAMEAANRIVGNEAGSAVLECTFDGGEYEFETKAKIAITGAEAEILINNKQVAPYQALEIKIGDRLKIGYPKRGMRSYLAIRGQLVVPKVMESYSTYVPGAFGGFEGRPLKANDILRWNLTSDKEIIETETEFQIPYFSSKLTLDVCPGPEWNWLNEHQKQRLFDGEYIVESTSNRMAIRFSGETIETKLPDMKSSAVAPGIIQLPPSGIPILLMKDAQTIGGYPRILHVANYQLWRAGQVRPGDRIRFRIVD
ncbi:MAG: biotin-dependent carboxyltransferase family protein [Balneolaceae bacterium]|nr:biotin-dependent carboxyltransferase family protein [Balneolaceae bacterium]